MIIKMFLRKIIKINFFPLFNYSQIIKRKTNPYYDIPASQLKQIVEKELLQKKFSVDFVNTLVSMGTAIQQHPDLQKTHMDKIIKNCENALNFIRDTQAQDHFRVEFGKLLKMIMRSQSQEAKKQICKVYSEVYCHIIFDLSEHLLIFEEISKCLDNSIERNPQIQSTKDLAKSLITYRVNKKIDEISLQEYLNFCRLFLDSILPSQFKYNIPLILKRESSTINPFNSCLLYYLTIAITNSSQLMEKLGFKAEKVGISVLKEESSEPKQICMALSILSQAGIQTWELIEKLNFSKWEYQYLIWISEYAKGLDNRIEEIHECILKKNIPNSLSISTILSFIDNASLTPEQHTNLAQWLAKQVSAHRIQKPSELCDLLEGLHNRNLLVFYKSFSKQVIKKSLGNFTWEYYNMIYYFGFVGGLLEEQGENMEYLRRYVLNGYAALGSARRQVPTSSYFYKILAVVDVNEFYANLS